MDNLFIQDSAKQLILSAALKFLYENPSDQLSLASIARTAKTSKPRVAYHFKNVNEVFIELSMAWAKSGKFFTDQYLGKHLGSSPHEIIILIGDATFEWQKNNPKIAHITPLLIHLSKVNGEIRVIMDQAMVKGVGRIEDLLKKEGKFPKKEMSTRAFSLHNTIIGSFLASQILTEKGRAEQRKRLNKSLILQLKV